MNKALLVVAGLSFVAGTAAAETKSWTALKGKVPADTIVLGGADISAVRGTPSFPKLVEWVASQDKDIAAMFDVVKQTCGMELPAMFGDISFAVDKELKGVIVIGLAGTDQTKLTDCINKVIAKVDAKTKLTAKPMGKLTEYSVTGESDKLYAAWLAPDVVAIGAEEKSHTALDAMLAGKAPAGDLAGWLGKANTGSPAWVAFSANEDGLQGGFGSLTLGKTIKLAMSMNGMTPADGDKGRKEMQDTVKKGLERSAKLPEIKKVFQGVKVGGKGQQVTIDASFPESLLPQLIPALDKVF